MYTYINVIIGEDYKQLSVVRIITKGVANLGSSLQPLPSCSTWSLIMVSTLLLGMPSSDNIN